MDELISKQAAITAIQKAYADTEGGEDKCAVWKNVGLTNALHIMQDLPSAQPKKGKWIEIEAFDDSRYVKCDQCKTVQVFYYGKRNTNFCPNCGADMRGD